MPDIFDLKNIDDLPKKVKNNLNPSNVRKNTRNLTCLFEIKEQLSIDEVIVALFRKHTLVKSRMWVSANLYNLKKKGYLERVDKKMGVYRKV